MGWVDVTLGGPLGGGVSVYRRNDFKYLLTADIFEFVLSYSSLLLAHM